MIDQPDGKTLKVAAVMTAPRYESVWARSVIQTALQQCRIPLAVSGGVYYGQCMQRFFEQHQESGAEVILTIDFDSVFLAGHVQRLLSFMATRPDIDAIAAVQPKRGSGTILATRGIEETIDWTGEPIQVYSAHFGLTAIRVDALRKVSKPYFVGVPDANGQWEGDKIDDDVWFWKQWQEAGNSLYIDPGCRLGHLEEMITIFDENMELKHIYPRQWDEFSDTTVE